MSSEAPISVLPAEILWMIIQELIFFDSPQTLYYFIATYPAAREIFRTSGPRAVINRLKLHADTLDAHQELRVGPNSARAPQWRDFSPKPMRAPQIEQLYACTRAWLEFTIHFINTNCDDRHRAAHQLNEFLSHHGWYMMSPHGLDSLRSPWKGTVHQKKRGSWYFTTHAAVLGSYAHKVGTNPRFPVPTGNVIWEADIWQDWTWYEIRLSAARHRAKMMPDSRGKNEVCFNNDMFFSSYHLPAEIVGRTSPEAEAAESLWCLSRSPETGDSSRQLRGLSAQRFRESGQTPELINGHALPTSAQNLRQSGYSPMDALWLASCGYEPTQALRAYGDSDSDSDSDAVNMS
ncbi:hypothetical protein EDC01DRAFT_777550 [Geopyxis carbonaria]|nr:hypothetical protein EDC01DRAFT_777550 [Geopyxis carbonaria]